jgi:hypothetical protein
MPLPGLAPLYEKTFGFFPYLHDCTLVRVESWQDGTESWAKFTVSCFTPEVENGDNSDVAYLQSYLYSFKLKDYVGVLPSTYLCNDIYSFDLDFLEGYIVGEMSIQPHMMIFKFSAKEFVEVALEFVAGPGARYLQSKDEMHYEEMQFLVRGKGTAKDES